MLDEFFSVHYSYGFLIIIMFLLYAGKRVSFYLIKILQQNMSFVEF